MSDEVRYITRDVRLLIAFAACRQTLFPIPVITLFWRHELGMSLADVMLLQAIFALAATLCEVPSGYVADRIGYRGSLLFAAWLWFAGWVLYALAGSFAGGVAAELALETAIVHWLEAIYHRRRRHSAIDMLSPVDYEERYWDRRAAA